MLSRLVLKRALLPGVSNNLSLVSVRLFKTTPPETFKPTCADIAKDNPELQKHLINWEYANSIFYGPERDHKNFPVQKMPEDCPPTRLGFLPDSWFQAFYDKTGVTGPYLFGTGLITFLLSKEIVIVEHQFAHFISFWLAIMFARYMVGHKVKDYYTKRCQEADEKMFYSPDRETKQNVEKCISAMESTIKSEEGQKYLWEAKKENIELQLEAAYRQRMVEAYQTVKKRLDYHVEVENLKKRTEQQHMVDWITKNVIKGITPQQEKESIVKCIADLKSLAAKHNVATA